MNLRFYRILQALTETFSVHKKTSALELSLRRNPEKITPEESLIDSASVSTRGSIEHVAHWDNRGHIP
jgi:hypothetical protein